MRSIVLRRALTWTLATLLLIGLAVALVIVWTADDRQWYVDTAGVNATLDLTLTSAGRWVATAVLGGLMALTLGLLAVEFASFRHFRVVEAEGASPPTAGRTFTYTPLTTAPARAPVAPEPATQEPATVRYESAVVGESGVRRAERSLSPGPPRHHEDETLRVGTYLSGPDDLPERRPFHSGTGGVDATRGYSTVPLRNGDRR